MSRKQWLITAVVSLLGCSVIGSLYLISVRPCWGINRERFEQIEVGMTRAEIVALLGRPPGDYSFFKQGVPGPEYSIKYLDELLNETEVWYSDRGQIRVMFEADRAIGGRFEDPDRDARWLNRLKDFFESFRFGW